ncbi:Clan CA, family C19, ubiquitin hydrolase-like cysteine peptidase [Trichomonas vaginalis G3]|uniref:Clan CA, family C19, ubiquitin hydrolase-like cysteine peptidase n=1 Tax=Trichomonas vaginalis (strain ATCC PRA-98 / G3) TaxID=412133 RepID=A2E2U2_TRIV3|nr:ubiquitinyl hydrolase protein [Trichomonas vaginalis G3]EAY12997.1 Clan CA, family C19, ubiquitin hydrolase-like cysteine peptidase [Trichomonas vaginalis G3]KAI5503125.1 ubiquitinyl hydrolase protein [Trichomonas vaginalis G3]|eukprot:XP_001325220.1 Clan CA, family C19, ubiquitin hydrolase-like cysteine peptidase [Trichomonas vaginalis G3]
MTERKARYEKNPITGNETAKITWNILNALNQKDNLIQSIFRAENIRFDVNFTVENSNTPFKILITILDLNEVKTVHYNVFVHYCVKKAIKQEGKIDLSPTSNTFTVSFNIKKSDLHDPSKGFIVDNILKVSFSLEFSKTIPTPVSQSQPNLLYFADEKNRLREQKKVTGFVGFKSAFLLCYVNTDLQFLFHLSKFKKLLFDIPPTKNPPSGVIFTTQRLFYKLMYKSTACSTTELLTLPEFKTYKDYQSQQNDAQEFLADYINLIENEVKDTQFKGQFNSLFEGKIKKTITCPEINYQTEREEILSELLLPVEGFADIYDSLNQFSDKNTIPDYVPSVEGAKPQKAIIKHVISKLPDIILVHLARTTYDRTTFQQKKITSKYEFYQDLDMSQYTTETKDTEYEAFAVVVHRGTKMDDGHYYVFVRSPGHYDWVKFDDYNVSISNKQEAIDGNYGNINYCAYLVLYARKSKISELFFDYNIADIPKDLLTIMNEMKEKEHLEKMSKTLNCKIITPDSISRSISETGNIITKYEEDFDVKISTNQKEFIQIITEKQKCPNNSIVFNCSDRGIPQTIIRPDPYIKISDRDHNFRVFISDIDQFETGISIIPVIIKVFFKNQLPPLQYLTLIPYNCDESKTVAHNFKQILKILNLPEDCEYKVYKENNNTTVEEIDKLNNLKVATAGSCENVLIFEPSKPLEPFGKYIDLCQKQLVPKKCSPNAIKVTSEIDTSSVEKFFTTYVTLSDLTVSDMFGVTKNLFIPLQYTVEETKQILAKLYEYNYNPLENSIAIYNASTNTPIDIKTQNSTVVMRLATLVRFISSNRINIEFINTINENNLENSIKVTLYCFNGEMCLRSLCLPISVATDVVNLFQRIYNLKIYNENQLLVAYRVINSKTTELMKLNEYILHNGLVIKLDVINQTQIKENQKVVSIRFGRKDKRESGEENFLCPFNFILNKDEKYETTCLRIFYSIKVLIPPRSDMLIYIEGPDISTKKKLVDRKDIILYDLIQEQQNLYVVFQNSSLVDANYPLQTSVSMSVL